MKSKLLTLAGASFAFLAATFLAASPQALSAPVPKMKPLPPVSLQVVQDAQQTDCINLTVTNNTEKEIAWKYSVSPSEAIEIAIADEKGKKLEVLHPSTLLSPFSLEERATSLSSNGTWPFTFRLKDCLRSAEPVTGKVTVSVTFVHGKEKYEAKPLVIDR